MGGFVPGFFVALAAFLQAVPPDPLLQGFEPVGDYLLEVDGEAAPAAEIYLSEKAPAYLVLTPEVTAAVLLVPRTRKVHTVTRGGLAHRDDGSVDVLANARLQDAGGFEVEQDRVVFSVGELGLVLHQKPPLLGSVDGAGLKAYSQEYSRLAAAYQPHSATLQALLGEPSKVEVQVYFGSWCPFCKKFVPRLLRVAEELQRSTIAVDYYGLPRAIHDDPITGQKKITRVPTGIVYRDGKEVGRLEGTAWENPELALAKLLGR